MGFDVDVHLEMTRFINTGIELQPSGGWLEEWEEKRKVIVIINIHCDDDDDDDDVHD